MWKALQNLTKTPVLTIFFSSYLGNHFRYEVLCALILLTMIIIPASRVISGRDIIARLVLPDRGRISREGVRAVALRNDSLRRPDGRDDGPVRVEKPHIGAVLVTDPKGSVAVDHQALGIHGDMGLGGTVRQILSEAVASPGSSRKEWEAIVGKAT